MSGLAKSGNILDTLGARSTSAGVDKSTPSALTGNIPPVAKSDTSGNSRGANLLDSAASKSEPAATAQTNTVDNATNSTQNSLDTNGNGDASVQATADSGSWSTENMMKEIKKLREENKATRIKYAETVEKLKSESDAKVVAKEQELQGLVVKAQELETIKAKEEDRKRDLSEKLAHRETRIAQLETILQSEKKTTEETVSKLTVQVDQFKAEQEAMLEVHKQRLQSEISNIPEKFKSIAEYIVKGAGDPRDALVALTEAKLNGLFEDKKVVVSHSVPGAKDGARSSKERLDAAASGMREKQDSASKIREGLKAIRSGEQNSVFRTR